MALPLSVDITPEPMDRLMTYGQMNKLDREGRITELIAKVFYNHAAPSIAHQQVSGNLFYLLYNYLLKNPIGRVFSAPCDVIFSEENVVQPDVVFVKKENFSIIKRYGIEGAPDLLVEIISDENYDVKKKLPLYATYNIPHLWYFDPYDEILKVYKLNGTVYEVMKVITRKGSFTHVLFPRLIVKGSVVFRDAG